MENKLEQLLNTLIQRGWKPRQHTDFVRCNYCDTYSEFSFETENESGIGNYTLRALVSKESGLWQFVCENEMIKSKTGVWVNGVDGMYKEILINQYDYRYRLIESALKDESELESFILDNIKVYD